METKYVRVPFEVELAKQITEKSVEGRIVARDSRSVRILSFDRKDKSRPIVALINDGATEIVYTFSLHGKVAIDDVVNTNDLMIEIPEYTTFKDGDVLISSMGNPFIFNGRISKYGNFGSYCGINISGDLVLDSNEWTMKVNGYANEKQKNILIGHLKRDRRNTAKEYLKRFFPNHSNSSNIGKNFEFTFKQDVLVRQNNKDLWCGAQFSHKELNHYVVFGGSYFLQCIPYNEQTAHLLGTTENYE